MPEFTTTVSAVRINNRTGEPKIVTLRVYLKEGTDGLVLDFGQNGVTGFEAYYLNSLEPKDETPSAGLWICAGTKGRYDGLWVPAIIFNQVLQAAKEAAQC